MRILYAGLTIVVVGIILAAVPARAQSPVGGALATLAAATARADQLQQAHRAAEATRQAESYQATVQAAATRTAVEAQCTRWAVDATATWQTMDVHATQAAMDAAARQRAADAMATAQANSMLVAATSTAQAQDAQATATVYALVYQQSRDQADLGRILLYIAAALALGGLAWVILALARAAARRVSKSPATWTPGAGGVVVDVTPVPALSGPTVRMPDGVRIVNDPNISARIEEWFYGGEHGN